MSTFVDEVRELRSRYPDERSAVMPALQLAQERHGGWLPEAALREVADALDLTPAYCLSIASFYDMLHVDPIGRHVGWLGQHESLDRMRVPSGVSHIEAADEIILASFENVGQGHAIDDEVVGESFLLTGTANSMHRAEFELRGRHELLPLKIEPARQFITGP